MQRQTLFLMLYLTECLQPAFFVRVFGVVLKRVFRGQKICALYFKICLTYFELCQTYFFFAPMRGKRTENQFSLFRTPNARFPTPVLRRPMSVYRNRPMNETLASFPTGRNRQNCAGLMPHTKKAGNTPIWKMFPANPRRAALKKCFSYFNAFKAAS